jgi:hypothetical protein
LQSYLISRSERPRTSCDATCDDEHVGEANRVLTASHRSAEPTKAGQTGTSDPVTGPASEPAMAKETELMVDAPVDLNTRQLGSGRDDLRCEPQIGGVLTRGVNARAWDAQRTVHQSRYGFALYRDQIPHGVESALKAGERLDTEPKNLVITSGASERRMAEATSDRDNEGRSLRSSLRTGKPSTWRREAVDTASKQEADLCPTM